MNESIAMEVTNPLSSEVIDETTHKYFNHQPSFVEKLFSCADCGKNFKEKFNLNQHRKIHLGEKSFGCTVCNKRFLRKFGLDRHMKSHVKSSIRYNCEQCPEGFSKKLDLLKHMKKDHPKPPMSYNCEKCEEVFIKKWELNLHVKKIHTNPPKTFSCYNCFEIFKRKDKWYQHLRTASCNQPIPSKAPYENIFADKVTHLQRESAFNVFSTTIISSDEDNNKDFSVFFNSIREDLSNEINYQLIEKRSFKWYAIVKADVFRSSPEVDSEIITTSFHSKIVTELSSDDIETHMDEAFMKIKNSSEKFFIHELGWQLEKINHLELSTVKYNPLRCTYK